MTPPTERDAKSFPARGMPGLVAMHWKEIQRFEEFLNVV
jgi:hypothetical protein